MALDHSDITGPYVQLATFCQTTLIDNTGSLSIIRMIDRYVVSGTAMEMQPVPVQITLALVLKSGFMRQKSKVTFKPISPSGVEVASIEFSVLFEGDERGVQLSLPFAMVLAEEGLYWCEIAVDGMLITKIPLRILYQRTAAGIQALGQ